MNYLIFQLQATLSSWGETAVGEYRPTANYPSESALLGLLAAALGIDRGDETIHQSLREHCHFAVGIQATGRLLRDYHTAQVPSKVSLKNRPHHTRRDELNLPKEDLNTILSTRDYRQDASCLVAVQLNPNAPYSLEQLAQALKEPKYVLYLGRKTCPPTLPLWPQVIESSNALEAIEKYRAQLVTVLGVNEVEPLAQMVWGDGIKSGCQHDLKVVRKDRLLSRRNWQFGDRYEYVAMLGEQ